MNTLVRQLKKQKEVELATLENLNEVSDTNTEDTLDVLVDLAKDEVAKLEALEDHLLLLDNRLASSTEALSDEEVNLHVELANVIGTAKHTLEALEAIQSDEIDDKQQVVVLLTKKTLLQRLKDAWTRLINFFKQKLSNRSFEAEMKKFDDVIKSTIEDVQKYQEQPANKAEFKARAKSLTELENIIKAHNQLNSILTQSVKSTTTTVESNLKTIKVSPTLLPYSNMLGRKNHVALDAASRMKNSGFKMNKRDAIDSKGVFITPDKEYTSGPAVIEDAGTKSVQSEFLKILGSVSPIKPNLDKCKTLGDKVKELGEKAAKELESNKDDHYAVVNSAQLKAISKYLGFLNGINKARRTVTSPLIKDIGAYASQFAKYMKTA